MRRASMGAAIVMVVACRAPDDAAVVSCETHPLSVNELTTCTVGVKRLSKATSATLDTESRNERVHVRAVLSIGHGSAKAELQGTRGGAAAVTVTEGEPPVVLEGDVPVIRSGRRFFIEFTPLSDGASALSGTIEHSAL